MCQNSTLSYGKIQIILLCNLKITTSTIRNDRQNNFEMKWSQQLGVGYKLASIGWVPCYSDNNNYKLKPILLRNYIRTQTISIFISIGVLVIGNCRNHGDKFSELNVTSFTRYPFTAWQDTWFSILFYYLNLCFHMKVWLYKKLINNNIVEA